jgi:hypothetical protein
MNLWTELNCRSGYLDCLISFAPSFGPYISVLYMMSAVYIFLVLHIARYPSLQESRWDIDRIIGNRETDEMTSSAEEQKSWGRSCLLPPGGFLFGCQIKWNRRPPPPSRSRHFWYHLGRVMCRERLDMGVHVRGFAYDITGMPYWS